MGEKKDWNRVAELVTARRAQLGYRRQEDAAAAADVGVTTWRKIEGGNGGEVRRAMKSAIATALQWPATMLDDIALGEDPPVTDDDRWRISIEDRLDQLDSMIVELRDLLMSSLQGEVKQ